MEIHRALLSALDRIAPNLFSEPISIIEAVSYDYHPVVERENYFVEPPDTVDSSFYYWKPFYLSSAHMPIEAKIRASRSDIKQILTARRKLNHWIAVAREGRLPLARAKQAWAVRRRPRTTGYFRLLNKGDLVFMLTENNHVQYYGSVSSTLIESVSGLEAYPLWIHFARVVTNFDIDVSEHMETNWFREIRYGGLFPVPNEFGSALSVEGDRQNREDKMWVQPNPYILYLTDFDAVEGNIFVVQAWNLRKTVYPAISRILDKENYVCRYSGDREGQVIFVAHPVPWTQVCLTRRV